MIDRWIKALNVKRQKNLPEELQALVFQMSAETQTAFREFPIDFVGGDVDVSPADGYGWAPVSVQIAKNLFHYPFTPTELGSAKKQIRLLELTFKRTEKYPCVEKNLKSMCLVHYRYPSAGNFRNFEAILRHRNLPLWNALVKADNEKQLRYDLLEFKRLVFLSGHNFEKVRAANKERPIISETFMKLNAALVQELVSWVQDQQLSVSAKYQFLVAVHPFTDFNGRTLRMWYRRAAGRPLFLNDFYCDLYCNRAEFAEALKLGNNQYDHIAKNILLLSKKASNDGHEKDFYFHQAFFEAAANATSVTNGRLEEFKRVSRAFFKDPEVMRKIKEKENGPVFSTFQNYVRKQNFVSP